MFAGLRGSEARNSFRVAGRAVWYPFAADSGFFYAGTYQGSKRVIGIGAGFDAQEDYHSYAADVFVEQPINGGAQGLTGQFDWTRSDGGTFLSNLPKQDSMLIEAGFHFLKGKLTPLAQYTRRTFDNPQTPRQSAWQAGWRIGWRGTSGTSRSRRAGFTQTASRTARRCWRSCRSSIWSGTRHAVSLQPAGLPFQPFREPLALAVGQQADRVETGGLEERRRRRPPPGRRRGRRASPGTP